MGFFVDDEYYDDENEDYSTEDLGPYDCEFADSCFDCKLWFCTLNQNEDYGN